MGMNFWEAQARARRYTTLYITIFSIFTIIIAFVAELALRVFSSDDYNPHIPYLGVGFILITFGVAFVNYLIYRQIGGRYVAESMNAREIRPTTTNPQEIQLMNIVQEIAIASSLPVPPIYIIDADQINAFAAGLTPDDAVIAVTRGSLNQLNRDELQGVIAHEFGHVSNGDMKISLCLAAMVMGFFFIFYIGIRLLQFSSFRSDGDRKGNPLVITALILFLAGIITYFAGSILQATVSRQREYLADASSVQFTRNPEGLTNALKKIMRSQANDMPKSGMAYAHLYFNYSSAWSSLFATHPPLEDRIAAIEGLPKK